MNTITEYQTQEGALRETSSDSDLPQSVEETREKLRNEAGAVFSNARKSAKHRADAVVDDTSLRFRNLESAAKAAKEKMSETQPDFVVEGWDFVGNRIASVADYFETKDSSEITDDIRSLVRERPAVTLGAIALAGFCVGRFLKAGGVENS